MIVEAHCKLGCNGCYYKDKECPDQESGKPTKEWSCVVKNCIYVEDKNNVEPLKN